MACSIKIINDHVKDTWFYGVEMTFTKTIDSVTSPMDLTGFGILMTLSLTENSPIAYEFTTNNDSIIITDAINGKIKLQPRGDLNNVGKYVMSFFLIDSNDRLDPLFSDYWEIITKPNKPNSITVING